jgi:hypothetical protein
MKRTKIILVALSAIVCGQMKAQSADYARSLISSGRDGEAARVIRTLAERGDAEGQYLAATFFLKGRGGMNKSEQQAVKYFKLSADQGYEDAINGLIDFYATKKQWDDVFMNAVKYCGRHPYLMKKYPGYINGLCRVCGFGTIQNEDKGWEMLENNDFLVRAQNNYPDSWAAYKQRHPEKFSVYDVVDQMPSFPGGKEALNAWLSQNINNYYMVKGRAVYSFVIERDGTVSDVKVVYRKGTVNEDTTKDTAQTLLKMPRWIPGKRNGVPVRVKYTIPINYN